MKNEYDFSKGTKGRFYTPESNIESPVYLNHENLEYFIRLSEEKKVTVTDLINTILSKDRELIETLK